MYWSMALVIISGVLEPTAVLVTGIITQYRKATRDDS